nr:acyltransferase [Propionibacterium sp.]
MSTTIDRPFGLDAESLGDALPASRPVRPSRPGASGRFAGLDGVRAVAILSVLVFHLYAGWLPGGFLGVDVFFVISGFLITSLLIRERATKGRIDLRAFWTRRARRLLPALAVCVGVSALVARAVSSDLVVGLPRQVLGAATFSTNWLEIAGGASYFDQTAPTLFMNFWSLAVEEQFYLVWPLATIGLLAALAPRLRAAVPAVAAVVSTVLMAVLYVPDADATRVYYGTDTHLMGLMIGAALAFAWASELRGRLADWVTRGRRWSGPLALLTLLVLMLVLSEESPITFRGGFALASLVTGVLVLATVARADGAGRPLRRTAWQRVLDAPAATWVGERSYGLYLWHWPVILIVDQLWLTTPGSAEFAARSLLAVVLTGLAAEASYRWVETPVRVDGFRATGGRVLVALRRLSPRRLRAAVGVGVLTGACLVATIATAPTESATARLLRQNAGVAAGAQAQPSPGTAVTPAPQTWAMPTGDEIDGFGDSVMVGSVAALQLYFPGIRLDAVSNRYVRDGLAAIQARGADTRRAVVLGFGMNAGVNADEFRSLLDALGPDRMVVVVNLYGTFARVQEDNAAIAQAVAGRPNVIVADWYATVAGSPAGLLQSDRKHPSLRGSHVYARTIQQAFATLSERHTSVPVTGLAEYPLPRR